jgi:uncharacterized membrane protein YgcG
MPSWVGAHPAVQRPYPTPAPKHGERTGQYNALAVVAQIERLHLAIELGRLRLGHDLGLRVVATAKSVVARAVEARAVEARAVEAKTVEGGGGEGGGGEGGGGEGGGGRLRRGRWRRGRWRRGRWR